MDIPQTPSRIGRVAKSICAYVAIAIVPFFVWPEISARLISVALAWSGTVRHWLIDRGYPALGQQFPIFSLHIPDFLVAFVGGALLGALGKWRWRRYALTFALAHLATQYMILPSWLTEQFHDVHHIWKFVLYEIIGVTAAALMGAWLASRPTKRLRERRRAAGLCEFCGYNLTGNVSGVCPECGTKTGVAPSTPGG